MKKFLFLTIFLIGTVLLSGCNNISIDENTEILFTGNLREDYKIYYEIKGTPEFFYDENGNSQLSGWEYIINIEPIDDAYKYEKQAMTVNFKSNIRLNNVIESDSEDKIVKLPQFGITITSDTVEMENNFGIYCPSRDGDNFVSVPGGEGIISDERVERDNNEYIFDIYNFIGPAKYINHYKKGNISMFYERGNGSGLIIDNPTMFSQNCMIEIGEIEDFLPLNLPFNLNFNNFEYTTIGFIKELSDTSNCISSHEINSPHNNYISFFTEDMSCQLWYETGTILQNINFTNNKDNVCMNEAILALRDMDTNNIFLNIDWSNWQETEKNMYRKGILNFYNFDREGKIEIKCSINKNDGSFSTSFGKLRFEE